MLPKLTDEDRERAGRKPLPKTMRSWMAELEGIQGFVKKRVELKAGNGQRWLDNMRAYYRSRALILSENAPGILPKDAAKIIVREVLKNLE